MQRRDKGAECIGNKSGRVVREDATPGATGQRSTSPVVRRLLIVAGSVSVGLGVIGVFVPLLPTTPFLLLAAACYARSSARLYGWLLSHRLLGRYIRNYREGKGTSLSVKVVAITMLWGAILYSTIWATQLLWVRVALLAVAIGVTTHLVRIPTVRKGRGE